MIAKAEVDNGLVVAIGTPGSDSFTFGTELWAMGQIALAPAHGIGVEAREVAADEDRLALLQNREVEAALVYGHVPASYGEDVRAIMALWPKGTITNEADPVQLLVHRDVAENVVYLLTKAMFEHANTLKSAHASLGIGLPSEAMTGLDIPLHAGAYRYYDEEGFGFDAAVGADYWAAAGKQPQDAAQPVLASTTYRDFDDAGLKQNEIDQIAAACRQALEVGALSAVLGDLSNTGCEVYQHLLVDGERAERNEPDTDDRQPQALAAFATSVQAGPDEDLRDNPLDSPVGGQGGPAIRWNPPEDIAGDGMELKLRPRVVRQPTM